MIKPDDKRIAVITGASSGIGKAVARVLAQSGWHVIGHGRNPERSAAAAAEIRAVAAPGVNVDMIVADLAVMAETARLAEHIAGLTDRVHVLINNAGGMCKDYVITPEGNEATFASNHLGHFLLTDRLLPLLTRAAQTGEPGAARIIGVSSSGHEYSPAINWDDLQKIQNWQYGESYCLVKLYNVLFIRELAKRVADKGIVANVMHPGVVNSNFASRTDPEMQEMLAAMPSISPEEAADTLVWLATAPEAGRVSGGYFHERTAIDPAPAALDDEAASRLWSESENLLLRTGV